jgi:tetratricopeptide (TPR) repeat protein
MRLLGCLVLCVFTLSLPRVVDAQTAGANSATVTGTVYSNSEKGLGNVLVKLCDPGANPVSQTFTGDTGRFEFRGLERGTYILTFDAAGYEKAEIPVDVSLTSANSIQVVLRPALASATSPATIVSSHELLMPKKARELMAEGKQKLYVQKNAREALSDFRRALDKARGYYEADYQMGVALLALGERAEAEKSFRKAVEISDGRFGDAYVGLGTLEVERGSVGEGETSLRNGVSLNPNSWLGFFELGKLELNRGHLPQALQMSERARSLSPNSPVVYRLLANIHIQQKDSRALLNDIDTYLTLDADSPAAARAKELRQQVEQQLAKEKSTNPPS